MTRFLRRNTYGFTFLDVAEVFPEKNRDYLAKILADMIKKGMLCKIAHNIYHIIPPQAHPDTYVPDRLQVAKHFMHKREYYIGYASALRIHGLTLWINEIAHQSEGDISNNRENANRDYVITKMQMKPATRSFRGITYQFIQHIPSRFFGFESIWISQLEKAFVSDLEKTIVDIATRPQYCGGIIDVGNALFLAKDRTDYDKLFYYFARNMNKSAKKRFLFLTELLDLEWTSEHERLMDELGSSISILDPAAPDQGRNRAEYGLKINVDPIRIRKEVFRQKRS